MELCNLDGGLEILINYSEEPTISLKGEVDFRNMERIKKAIMSLVDRGKTSINIDLRGLIFLDSTGVSALIDAANAITPKGGDLKLVTTGETLPHMLAKCGVSGLFHYEHVSGPHPVSDSTTRKVTRDIVEFDVPSKPQMLSYIRSRAADFACSLPFSQEDIEDIKLAIGEAATNAIRHGASRDCKKVKIRFERGEKEMKVAVSDKGDGFDPNKICPPNHGEMCEGGRGIMFMRALMDEVKFHAEEPGTRVEMTKKFRVS